MFDQLFGSLGAMYPKFSTQSSSRRASLRGRPSWNIERLEGRQLLTNLAPVAVDDSYTVNANAPGTLYPAANDYDPDGPPPSITSATNGEYGNVTVTGNAVQYTPFQSFTGVDSFTYTVTDSNGATDVGVVTVTVNATPVVTMSISYGSQRSVTLTGQVTCDNPGSLTVVFTGALGGSVVTESDGSFTYTGNASTLGQISATLQGVQSTTATVQVTSTKPVIQNLQAVHEGGWVIISGHVNDESAPGLQINFGGCLQGGTATVNTQGNFYYSVQESSLFYYYGTAKVTDWWGLESDIAMIYVG